MSDDAINNGNDGYTRPPAPVLPRSSLDRSGSLIVPPRPSGPKQPFERLLDQMRDSRPEPAGAAPRSSPEVAAPETQPPVNPVARQQERPRSFQEEMQKRNRDDEPREPQKGRNLASGEKPRGKEAEQRVIARPPLSERQRDGQGKGGGKEGSNQGPGYRLSSALLTPGMKTLSKGKIQELGQSAFLQNLKALQTASETRAKTPTVFSKALLDQIVRYVRLLTRADGEKEMEVSLHEKVFKGLRLKVATAGSRVEATFMTPSEEVRELFLAHRREIEQTLKEKGIEVRKINVIMIQRA